MSASFIAASSQFLKRSAISPFPTTGYPISFGAWVNTPAASGTAKFIWSISRTSVADEYLFMRVGTTNLASIGARQTGGGDTVANAATALAAGTWNYVVGRFTSATNRRIAVLQSTGVVEHNQSTTNIAPASMNAYAYGVSLSSSNDAFFGGLIAETWLTNTDIQADGAQLQDATIRQLAYGGPFSIPHIMKDIVEYHSFRDHLSSDTFSNEADDVLPLLGEALVNTAGVTVGAHPPLPYWYAHPKDRQIPFVI